MISVVNLSKNYGSKVLFRSVSLTVNRQEKIGLIGPNGTGKSTLFAMILKEVEPSSGTLQVDSGIRIGYLPQEARFHSEHTVITEITEGDTTIVKLKKEKNELEAKNLAGSKRYGEILHELEVLDYFELEHKAKKVLMGLGFKEADFQKPITQLSGGWQMRTLLAKLLTNHYDLLLLDEPTNYLDLNAALWLKDFLAGFRGTFIMISHDKAFLNEVTNYSLILEYGSIFKVRGNYEHYEQIKQERRLHLLKQFKEQERKRQQLEEFVRRFHAQPNKAAAVRAKRTQLEKLEEIVVPPDPRESIGMFRFPATRKSGYRVMRLEKVSKSYGENQVYRDFDFEITQGEKAVLAGENGAGKSTLLKILAGVLPIDDGRRIVGHQVDIGYFSQTRLDVLNPENTCLQEAYASASGFMSEEAIRTLLGIFLFTGDDAFKKVKVLSGGEKSRLILAKLLINPPNLLLLDEPTTHLDVDAVEALIQALNDYEGTIVCISHDIYFVRSLANTVFEVKEGRVRKFPGNFDYYLDKQAQEQVLLQQYSVQDSVVVNKQGEVRAKEHAKEQARQKRQEEEQRKQHNKVLQTKINKLLEELDQLNLEYYAKARALADSKVYRNEETARAYGRRVKEIEKRKLEIEGEVAGLKDLLRK
ncbi:MAG: ABC-F family ATP-binding cassette domain-containing protein [Candidatus Omnitrophica bacterium]|nr:ABC-F family ATP-binding cassette domain-containing protein [Candidatus Omnitrophota bacterium]